MDWLTYLTIAVIAFIAVGFIYIAIRLQLKDKY